MISSVTFERTLFNTLPHRFEAGTPHIAGAVGLAAAIDYLQAIGLDHIAAYEHDLLAYATAALSEIPGIRVIGTAGRKAGILSFVLDGVHPHDVGTILDRRRRRDSRRTSLLPAADDPARRGRDRAGLAGALHHARRDRRAGGRAAQVREVFG